MKMRGLAILLLVLLFASVRGAAQAPAGLDVAAWFPIRQGDTWTYDWTYRIGPDRQAPAQTVKRTRAFEGREFGNTGMTDKLASENGDYALFALNENGLYLHGGAEMQRDARFVFDPPIPVLTREMKPGEWLRTEQLADDGRTTRRFATRFEPVASITSPMGKFEDCLKVIWTLDDESQHHATTYYLARGIGIVAYALEIKVMKPHAFEMTVDARLTLAQLQGRTFKQAADIPLFVASKKSAPENGRARAMFRKAHESQYVWDRKFPGFAAEFRYVRDGEAPVAGRLTVDRQLQVEVQCADPSVRAAVHAELSQLVSYRQAKPFLELYPLESAQIGFGEINDLTSEIVVSDEMAAGSSFLLHDREIVRISRSYGRVRFVNQLRSFKADDGRYIANEAELTYYSNETGAGVGQTIYKDRYEKLGGWWLPVERRKTETARARSQTIEIVFSGVAFGK
jgi:hypothetical protein